MSHPLTSRQEAFARHFAATGNAAEAARKAGYAAGSARQTGHDLLEKPWVLDRIRAIRLHWRQVARAEAAILLDRLEQAWDVAVAANDGRGSATQMLQVIRLQAEIAGITRRGKASRADLWPMPDDPADRTADAAGSSAIRTGEGAMATPPLTAAVRRGRDRAERSLADHRRRLRTLGDRPDFDARRHLAVQQQLTAAIDARRRLTVALPDISLHDDALATEAPPLPAENAEIDGLEAGRVAETAGRGAGLGLPDRALRGQTA